MKILWFLTLLFFAAPCMADSLPLQSFGMLPIAHEGRIKPLSVFAREQLKEFSGESAWRKKPAIDWLAHMLFTPQKMEKFHLIRMQNEALREMLGLPLRATHRYALAELHQALRDRLPEVLAAVMASQQKKPLTPLQESLAELYAKVQHFQQLQDSLIFLLPFPGDPSTTYYELAKHHKQSPLMAKMEERGRMSSVLAVVPSPWEGDTDWYSPWMLRFNGKASPQTAQLVKAWQKMATAYRSGHLWPEAVKEAAAAVETLGGSEYHPLRLWLEEWYYRLSFLSLAIGCYIAFVLSALLPRRIRGRAGALFLFAGMSLHILALLVRMIILNRPPVSNLYESVLFVSLLIAGAGGFSAWRQRRKLLAIGAAGMAAFLLLLSQSLLSGQEQLPVVMAVLNTDFWLATHVICITSGYAAAVLASLTAHYQLYHLSHRERPKSSQALPLCALLLTAVGTLLGGIWADQSWGRFWGWDPKENGAMLIVLWLIWLIHGRIAGQFSERWYLAGMAFLNGIVALAWFGVNLLSVGLHSYGFTQGTAWGLVGFLVAEAALIASLIGRSYRHA